jgi:hypothetical protein
MQGRRLLTSVAVLTALASGGPVSMRPASAARVLAPVSTIRVVISRQARVLDLGPGGNIAPPGWDTPGFDDAHWAHAALVPRAVAACATKQARGWPGFPPYWGPKPSNYYLLRQHLRLPPAPSYAGSVLALKANMENVEVYLNAGVPLVAAMGDGLSRQVPIGGRLHRGDNVVAATLNPAIASALPSGVLCSAFSFIVTVHARGVTGR